MAPRTTFEHVDNTNQSEVSHPVGSKVEVMWNMPRLQRTFAYLGHISVEQEDQGQQSDIVYKYGPERIKRVAARYTLKTESITIHQYIETDDGVEVIESRESQYVSDLIFDATNPAFTITPVTESIPQPRVQL